MFSPTCSQSKGPIVAFTGAFCKKSFDLSGEWALILSPDRQLINFEPRPQPAHFRSCLIGALLTSIALIQPIDTRLLSATSEHFASCCRVYHCQHYERLCTT